MPKTRKCENRIQRQGENRIQRQGDKMLHEQKAAICLSFLHHELDEFVIWQILVSSFER